MGEPRTNNESIQTEISNQKQHGHQHFQDAFDMQNKYINTGMYLYFIRFKAFMETKMTVIC